MIELAVRCMALLERLVAALVFVTGNAGEAPPTDGNGDELEDDGDELEAGDD